MTQISTITGRDAFGPPPVSAGYKVDISRGDRIGRVSSEWFSRPDDERYLSLTDLHDAVHRRAERATAQTVESRAVRVEASREAAERLALILPGRDEPVSPTPRSRSEARRVGKEGVRTVRSRGAARP